MSRTTPDPVFAAAARAEVERRVRSTGASAVRRRRPWVVELTAIAGVAVLVAGIAVGVTALRPVLEAGGAPAGAATGSPAVTRSPAVTAEPSSTPTDPPTSDAPTAPPTATAPATEEPVAPTTAPPTVPPTTATTAPPPATPSALVGPTGAKQRTSAEIRAWALTLSSDANGRIWAEQAVLDTTCMADHGFLYDPELAYSAGLAAQHAGLTDAQYAAYQVAEYGPDTDLPYDWRTAGCHGRSVHLTGQDGKD